MHRLVKDKILFAKIAQSKKYQILNFANIAQVRKAQNIYFCQYCTI